MKTGRPVILISLSLAVILGSCVSHKQLTYLRYSAKSPGYDVSGSDIRSYVTPPDYKIMPFDNLYIRVITPDPQWSELFNVTTGMGGLTQESAALSGYSVDLEGNIEIPFVGKISVAGKEISEIKVELDSVFKSYVTDAEISIRLVNNYLTVLGEVASPGRYPLTKDRVNIFEAVAMAGDLSYFSNRQKVQLIRPSPYGPVVKEFTLLDRSILTSELYYIMPNDIIYVMPGRGRTFQINSSFWTLFLTTVTASLGIIGFFRTL